MAFVTTKLCLLAYGDGRSLWSYRSNDTAAVIDTAGYFNNGADQLNVGDVIYVSADEDGTPAFGHMIVNANNGTTVDVADLNALGGTDTD
jgi:hypothetical protein